MHRYKQEETAQTPSWKKLELECRSTSFPAAVSVQNPLIVSDTCEGTHVRRNHEPEDDGITSWAKTLQGLAQSTISLSSPPRDIAGRLKRKTGDMESHPRSPLRIPVLTVTLINLHDVFEKFCRHITNATFAKAQAACLVLDAAEIAASPKISEPNSPAKIIDSPGSHKSSSPSRSPITSWFTGSFASETDDSQKSEWENACNPLILFAGLEVLYCSCSHVESNAQALSLMRLYKRNIDDLRHVQKALCDPFVYSTRNEVTPETTSISSYKAKAVALSLSIESIMSLCQCRCKLIEQHMILCTSENFDTEKVIATFQMILQSVPKEVAKSKPIVQSVLREVEGWCNIMKTYGSFGKYRFMNTIIGCQEIKLTLNASCDTCIQKWMSKVFQSFVSMLPIYFESVGLDVISRYGYQESSFRVKTGESRYGPNLDIESKLEEFLRFEERSGTPFAIAVVVGIAGFHMYRSISNYSSLIAGKEKTSSTSRSILEPSDMLSAFPAVYIRRTSDHSLSGKILGARRNSEKKDIDYDYTFEKSRPGNINSKIDVTSWPYTSWNNIIPVLKNSIPLSSDDESVRIDWSQVDSDTSIYASPLDDVMWLVAMKRTNDDTRWNRRSDEEHIRKERQLFSDLLSCLRLREIFKSNLKVESDNADPLLNELSDTSAGNSLLDHDKTSQVLESFKRIFGLRSPRHGTQFRKQNVTISPQFLKGHDMLGSSPVPSHFTFFLGSHAVDLLGDK